MFNYECLDCCLKREHFVLDISKEKLCPKCKSKNYMRQPAVFKVNVEYSDGQMSFDKKIAPHIDDTYARIGKEAANGDTQTLENIFGSNKVANAFEEEDY